MNRIFCFDTKLFTQVTVFIRHTHKEVSLEDLDSWVAINGTLLSPSKFCKNASGEFETDIYKVDLRLRYLILICPLGENVPGFIIMVSDFTA
jgi:hypothetical protein